MELFSDRPNVDDKIKPSASAAARKLLSAQGKNSWRKNDQCEHATSLQALRFPGEPVIHTLIHSFCG
jgi:hypothetical protein